VGILEGGIDQGREAVEEGIRGSLAEVHLVEDRHPGTEGQHRQGILEQPGSHQEAVEVGSPEVGTVQGRVAAEEDSAEEGNWVAEDSQREGNLQGGILGEGSLREDSLQVGIEAEQGKMVEQSLLAEAS
jgi:hypothetical protein